jgi:hypothetical protein
MKWSILALTAITSIAVAKPYAPPDFSDSKAMANYYQEQIRQRERDNAEKWRDLEQRQRDEEIRDELREQRQQYEVDRMIDEGR